MPRPALQLVNPETGEITACPHCADKDIVIEALKDKYQGLLLENARLKKDYEAEARSHQLWPIAHRIFTWWQEATGHKRTKWPGQKGERFWLLHRYLKEPNGHNEVRWAMAGFLASDFHHKRGEYADREGPRYDEFERPFKDQATFEKWRDRGMPSQETRDFFEWVDQLPR